MARVRIKTPNVKDPRMKQKLLDIMSSSEVYVFNIIEANDAFVIITNSETDLDRIFNGQTDTLLEQDQFSPQLPPEL